MKKVSLEEAAEIIKDGGVLIFPTDTVYGIGADLSNKSAVDRIYGIKNTPKTQKFPVLVSGISQVRQLAKVNKTAQQLMDKYWPGALTIILEKRSDGEKIGFRLPDSDLVKKLIDIAGMPIIGTSANFHGKPTPKSFGELDPELAEMSDGVVEGACELMKESTVVDASSQKPVILRKGALSLEADDFNN